MSIKSYWRWGVGTSGGAAVLLLLSAILLISINGITRTPTFCGSCHFEKPLYQTWQASSHALGSNFYDHQVVCVDCHVAQGLGGYLGGKMRGIGHITIQYLGLPHAPRPPQQVRTSIPDDNCLQCHTATPHRMDELGESDVPLIDEQWITDNRSNIEPDELGRKLGLIMAHRAHMSLVDECAGCHIEARRRYPQMETNAVLASLPENPMGCVSCHRDVVHRRLHLDADSTKYFEIIAGTKVLVDVPSEKQVCGRCHKENHECLWENGQDRFTFSVFSGDYCVKCHPGQSVF